MWVLWLRLFVFVFAVPLIPFALWELPGLSWVQETHAAYVFFMGAVLLASDVFFPIPASLLAVFLGASLGFTAGTLAIALGLNLGSLIGYYTGWYFGYPLVFRYASEEHRSTIDDLARRFGYFTLAIVRAVPVLAEATVLGAGAARLKGRPVLLTLLLTNSGLAFLYAGFGSAGRIHSSSALLALGGIGVPACGILAVYIGRRLKHRFARSSSKDRPPKRDRWAGGFGIDA